MFKPACVFIAAAALAASACAEKYPAVKAVAAQTIMLSNGQLAADVSLDWSKPQPQVERAVIVIHGLDRNVDGAYQAAQHAAELAGHGADKRTLIVAPQFLTEGDAKAHDFSSNTLRWHTDGWIGGADSVGPTAVSSYAAIDAMVEHLADRKLYPNLKTIVIAGHSAGGQTVQRYALTGHAEQMVSSGIRVRYIVANPSSYFYFTDDRPTFDGDTLTGFASGAKGCDTFNHWKYGQNGIKEPYVLASAKAGWSVLEQSYAQKDITYLLGTADVDPHQKDLDVSCAGEAEGASRFLRGQAYFAYLTQRNDATHQRLWFVPDVGHNSLKMFGSDCGAAAMFEQTSCKNQR